MTSDTKASIKDNLATADENPCEQERCKDEDIATYAGFWRRLAAFLVDYIVFFGLMVLIIKLTNFLFDYYSIPLKQQDVLLNYTFHISLIVVGWLYATLMESSSLQATVGKLLMGLRVTNCCNGKSSFWKITIRHFAKILSILTIVVSFIMLWTTSRNQTLHDKLAGCCIKNRQD